MSSKYMLAAALLIVLTFGGVIAACISQRIRDAFFFLLVTTSCITERIDVNFVSREWYRGTTCGYEVSLVDVFSISLLGSMFLFPRRGQKRFYWPASLGWMILFFLFTAGCVSISEPKLFGLFELSKMIRGIVMFVAVALYLRSERELKLLIFSLATIVCFEGLKGLEDRFRWDIDRVFADLNAPNSLSMYMCMISPVFVAAINSRLPRWLKIYCGIAIGLAGISVLLTISRLGVITLGSVLFATLLVTISWKITARKILLTCCVCLAVVAALGGTWKSLSARFGEASLKQEYENKHSQGRGYYLRMAAALVENHPFGVGPNNWSYWVSNEYGPRMGFRFAPYPGTDKAPKFEVGVNANVDDPQAAPAHSLGALTVGEMGFPGLFMFVLLWLRWFQMGFVFLFKRTSDPMHRIGVGIFFGTVGLFLQSLTEWVYHQTAIYYTFHILLGTLAGLYCLKRKVRRDERLQRREAKEETLEMIPEPLPSY